MLKLTGNAALRRTLLAGAAVVLAIGCAACSAQPRQAATAASLPATPGLDRVPIKGLDAAEIRPGTRFSTYSGLFLEAPALVFRPVDPATPKVTIADEQRQRFLDALDAALRQELAGLRELPPASAAGPGILALKVTVEDIAISVAPDTVSRGGWGSLLLHAVGEATLVLELRDSASGELLARGIDARAVKGTAMSRDGGMVTRWEGVQELCAHWAVATRDRLRNLVKGT